MRDAGIMDGDLLAVQSTKDAKNGQIIVARLGDEVTVKRFRRNKHLIELHPENPDYQTIVVEPGEPFEIEGLAVGLIRNTMFLPFHLQLRYDFREYDILRKFYVHAQNGST